MVFPAVDDPEDDEDAGDEAVEVPLIFAYFLTSTIVEGESQRTPVDVVNNACLIAKYYDSLHAKSIYCAIDTAV